MQNWHHLVSPKVNHQKRKVEHCINFTYANIVRKANLSYNIQYSVTIIMLITTMIG